jgi:hypothetical protein
LGDLAAIYIQRGAPAGKQTTACLQYARTEHLPMISIVPYYALDEAVRMVKDRIVNVIIVAFDSRVARQLAVATEEFGGQVVFVHPTPGTIHPPRPSTLPDMDALILRWWDAGRTAHEIAQDIGGETTDVAAVLRRGGRQISRPY